MSLSLSPPFLHLFPHDQKTASHADVISLQYRKEYEELFCCDFHVMLSKLWKTFSWLTTGADKGEVLDWGFRWRASLPLFLWPGTYAPRFSVGRTWYKSASVGKRYNLSETLRSTAQGATESKWLPVKGLESSVFLSSIPSSVIWLWLPLGLSCALGFWACIYLRTGNLEWVMVSSALILSVGGNLGRKDGDLNYWYLC